jgi:exopolyphosphatase/guanosine-5'-triphosphate,3'-diphosphate pyrophosphatase
VGTSSEVYFTRSEPMGALRVSQKFDLETSVDADAVDQCRRYVRSTLKKTLTRVKALGFDFTIGTSGTIVTLATIGAETPAGKPVSSGLRWLSRARLRELIDELAPLTTADRARRFSGLDERRAGTIVGGAIVLEQVMKQLDIEQIRACDAALREGIVEFVLDRQRHEKRRDAGSVRRSSVMALAERSDVDLTHASHVARLALRIFDQMHDVHRLRTGERELLESAALLHEVGTHVSFQSHHKHSYYLISHAGLRGFTGDQVAMIANVARYYRKALPDPDHANFAQLSLTQRAVVEKLVAILRIADALDRGRRGAIRDVSLHLNDGAVNFHLRPRTAADVEVEAALKKAKYFARVFERKVSFEVSL